MRFWFMTIWTLKSIFAMRAASIMSSRISFLNTLKVPVVRLCGWIT